MAEQQNWLQRWTNRLNPMNDPSRSAAVSGANMIVPGLGYAVGGLIDWNRGRNFNNASDQFNEGNAGFSSQVQNRIDSKPLNGILGQFGGSQPEQPTTDPNEHPSQRRPYDATVTPFNAQSPQLPSNYDAGWRTGEGGSGLGGGWSTANGNRLQALFGDLGASGTGSLAGDGQALLPRFANEFGRARQNGRDAGEMAAPRAQKPLTGVSLTAKDYIRTHPEEWARMQQEMRSRGG